MTNVEALKETLVEHAKLLANIGDDFRAKEIKIWYLTGVMNGFLEGSDICLSHDEFMEMLDFKVKLAKEA